MDDYISLAQKLITLVTGGLALWKAFNAAASASKDDPGSKFGFLKGWKAGGDLGLYAIALLVAAIASLSLASALLTQKELVAWSGAPYILIVVAIVSAVACVLPIGARRDLRHLFWIGLAGLIPAIIVVVRGGKTNTADDSGQVWIPLFVWVFLTSALAVYSISKSGQTLEHQKAVLPMGAVLIVICALALGVYWTDTLKDDPKGHSRGEKVVALKKRIDQLNRADQMTFYQLASETALTAQYTGSTSKSPPSRPPSRNPNASPDFTLADWTKNTEENLNALSPKDQHDIFRKRLDGVHPVPKPGEPRVATNLPGIEAKERFEYFNTQLIIHALTQYEGIQEAFFSATDSAYTESVRERFKKDPTLSLNVPGPVGNLLRGKKSSQPADSGAETYTLIEAEIFGLPTQQSSEIALNYYKKLAFESVTNGGNKDVSSPVELFQKMTQPERSAFLNYARTDEVLALLALLHQHASEDPVAKLFTRANQQTVDQLEALRKSQTVNGDDETKKFIQDLSALLETADRETVLVNLLRAGALNPLVSVTLLFKEDPLALAAELNNNFTAGERAQAIAIMADPLGEGVKGFLSSTPQAAQIGPVLGDFLKMPQDDREALLHNISLDVYGQGGDHTLGFFSQTVDNVGQNGLALGIGIATLFCIPAVFVTSLIGAAFGKQLLSLSFSSEKLERAPKSVIEEQAQTLPQWGFVGRRTLLDRLQRLSVRSSGTVGLVGRRGIGKTRILRQLLQEYDDLGAVTVWLDCPTSMSQEDFVQSISERVVDIVESRFANFAGIPNNSRRRLDRTVVSGTALAVLFLSLLYAAVIASSLPDLTPSLVVPTLIVPSLLVAACGLGLLLIRFSGSAASARFSRGGVALGDATFEWQQAYDAMARMADRLAARRTSGSKFRWSDSPISLGLAAAPAGFLLSIVVIYLLAEYPWAFGSVALLGVFYVGWRSVMSRGRVGDAGFSAVSFTYRFREFVMEISDRIRAGALGKNLADSEIVMVVVVDELDKIVDREELKTFIRVIKTVFDIRGTRFFLSISQDAYRDLVLGSALGKNEFDSSFDHIELIAPMDLDAARSLVKGYLKSLKQTELDDPTVDVIAVLGKGVPRDLLRRCDNAMLLASEKPASLSDSLLMSERESLLAGLRYLAGLSDRIAQVFTDPKPPLDVVLDLIASDETKEPLARILSENFVYVHILSTPDPKERHELITRYYGFLYSLPTLTTESIRSALAMVTERADTVGQEN
jgi:KAP family P-loop domain